MHSQQFSLKALAAVLSIFSTSISAHMIMSSPAPYGKSTLNNSPLAGDGSDFPCKQRTGVYDAEGASNVMAVGSTNTLAFIGSAVHGGGSCQVSLSTDLQPTKDSKWMVIHSIEGGCPANVTGNLPSGSATAPDPTSFEYTIPQGIAPGDYTIAWSWVNKVGNREFYMNCGPATITAAAKKRYALTEETSPNFKRQTTFPDLFVANLQGVDNGCTTTENIDIQYPDPGSSVQTCSGPDCGAPVGCAGVNAAASASTPTATAAAGGSSASSAASPAGSSAPASSASGGGVFATGAASLSSAAPAEATSTAIVSPIPEASTPVASAAPAAATSSSSSSTTTTSGAQTAGAACSPEGAWACSSDGTSFQRCASGVWSVSMQMAAGTSCTPGTSETLTENVTSAKKKRHSLHARRSHRAYAKLSN